MNSKVSDEVTSLSFALNHRCVVIDFNGRPFKFNTLIKINLINMNFISN